ncbi:DUF6894 family protein [Croceibacterium xixiisoli]|uniref:DUF6894 family protein n=1 Tax=Croceibacterium xixiisoli TaxID=1476466 RepID=UPI003606FDEC
MPLYRFQIRSGDQQFFSVEFDLSGTVAARTEAVKTLGQMLCDNPTSVWDDGDCQIEVSDERGLTLYVVQVCALKAASTKFTGR